MQDEVDTLTIDKKREILRSLAEIAYAEWTTEKLSGNFKVRDENIKRQ